MHELDINIRCAWGVLKRRLISKTNFNTLPLILSSQDAYEVNSTNIPVL